MRYRLSKKHFSNKAGGRERERERGRERERAQTHFHAVKHTLYARGGEKVRDVRVVSQPRKKKKNIGTNKKQTTRKDSGNLRKRTFKKAPQNTETHNVKKHSDREQTTKPLVERGKMERGREVIVVVADT